MSLKAVGTDQRRDLLGVELLIVCVVNAVPELFLRKVSQQKLHDLPCDFLVGLSDQSLQVKIKGGNDLRHEQAAVPGKALQDRLGSGQTLLSASCAAVQDLFHNQTPFLFSWNDGHSGIKIRNK